jgi:tetratricopeptide (TPR) repeat protein
MKISLTSTLRTAAVLAASLSMVLTSGCHRDPNKAKHSYLDSGKRYASEGKLKEASIQFQNALRIDHNFGDAHYEMAKVYLKQGTLMPAYAELMRTVDLQPGNVKARIDLGNLLLAGKQADKAEAQAKAVLVLQSNNADAYALLAGVAATRGDRDEALTQIQHALSIDPNRSAFHTTLGLLQSADPATAGAGEDQLRKAVSLNAKDTTAAIVLASMLEKKGDLQGAQQQLQAAQSADPKNVTVRAALAEVFLKQNDSAKAEQTLQQAANDLSDTTQGAELLANYYIGTKQIAHGETVYADLVAKHPKSVPLKLAYARLLVLNHDIPKAREIGQDLAKTDSSLPDVAVLNGMLLLNDGKVNDAFNLLQKSAKSNPDNLPVKLWLGRAAMAKGDTATAQQSFTDAANINPRNMEAQQALAGIAIQNHDNSSLIDVAQKVMTANPQASTPYVWRGIAEANQKLYDKAEADFHHALQLDPKNWEADIQLGQLRLIQKKIPESKALFEQALTVNPTATHALSLLITAMAVEKQPLKNMIARVQDQITKAPPTGTATGDMYNLLSSLQLSSGDKQGSLASAEKAMQLNPMDASSAMSYSRAQISLGNAPKAIEKWQQWTKDHPTDAQAFTVLGSLQEAQGDTDGAVASYKQALSIQPEQPIAANNLSYLMIQTGQNADVALSLAEIARRALPDSPDTADTLAWAYYTKGSYSSARDLLEDAAKAEPNSASIHYHLGMTYMKLSKSADAAAELKKAVDLAPNTPTARDAQKALSSIG